MYRSHNCGELNASHINTEVTCWLGSKSRDKGFMNWIDLRDRWNNTIDFDEGRTETVLN
jgi:aspartyl-tRNA synthetase